MTESKIIELIETLALQLVTQHKMIATAESCTGGLVSKLCTDLSGSSQWFDCGITTYSNQSKINLLNVSASTLDTHGAVSQAVVREMVIGLLNTSTVDIGVSISGIAGPSGGDEKKPVGTVWIAWATSGSLVEEVLFQFEGNREQVRLQAAYEAIKGITERLNK